MATAKTTRERWKAAERWVASLIGGKRLANNGMRQADIDHPLFHLEVKVRSTVPEWWVLAEQALKTCPPEKIPAIIYIAAPPNRARRPYLILPLDNPSVQELIRGIETTAPATELPD